MTEAIVDVRECNFAGKNLSGKVGGGGGRQGVVATGR